eukprot:gene9623-9784_t
MAAQRPVTSTIWGELITDRETGRPKGFGFCEFYDKATAESAHRNLNGHELHGRNIRIDFAEEFSLKVRDAGSRPPVQPPPSNRSSDHQLIGFAAAAQSAQQVAGLLGGPPSNDRRVQDQLNELLASKSRPELWEVLRLLKEFLGGDRAAARSYFAERPALAKAVFQAQVLLGMVKPPPGAPTPPAAAPPVMPGYSQQPGGSFQEGPIGLAGRMAGNVPPPPPPRPAAAGGPMGLQPAPPVLQPPPPGVPVLVMDPASGQPQTVVAVPPTQLGGVPMAVQPPPQQPGMLQPPPPAMQQMQEIPMQPSQPMQQVAPPQPPPSGGAAGAFAGQDAAQMQALLRQVQTMTDEQINMLPEQFRNQVLFVKEQIRLGYVKVE